MRGDTHAPAAGTDANTRDTAPVSVVVVSTALLELVRTSWIHRRRLRFGRT
ncbi:hypothetical protein WSS_A30379 [Rhodococcus opacus M213]|uniref:Uncharacterized protein n=1 Tax=Rhodococcus opacus M213 TaxID=1129896 RepID=K8XBI8_RHOOP|nr:hypothetical protein WSS_A30379 [Rhodococcus opacus M213]